MTSGNAGAVPDATECAHCGLPLPGSGRRAPREPGGLAERFCCSGCFLAHRLGASALEGGADRLRARLVLAAFLAMGVMVFSLSLYGEALGDGSEAGPAAEALRGVFRLGALALSTPVVALLGVPLAVATVRMRRFLSADALVLAGSLAAYLVSTWHAFAGGGAVYFDTATMVVVLFATGKWLEARTRERSLAELRRLAPELEGDAVRLVDAGGGEREETVRPGELRLGDRVRLRPGETVPVDGTVVSGRSFVDTSDLTGEADPRALGAGAAVLAGSRLVDGTLVVRATAVAGGRLRDAIERLLDEATTRRARWVRLADRLAAWLVPTVAVLALATLVLRWRVAGPGQALLDALSVALISCPCALGIATPLAFWTAIGEAWRRGVLVRSSEALERLAGARRAFLDKTGTLTSGELELVGIVPRAGLGAPEALRCAAALERGSEHPIGRCLRRSQEAAGSSEVLPRVQDFRALPGIGVVGSVGGAEHALVRSEERDEERTVVRLLRGGVPIADFELRADLRPEARQAVRDLADRGLAPEVLTGDSEGASRALAREIGIPVRAELSPADKVAALREAGPLTLFVGDGLNDAAALAAAGVGVTVAGGSPRSLQAAEVHLLRPGLGALADAIDLARAAVRVARGNLAWAFAYNAVGLSLAVSGRLSPVFAASAMVVSSVGVVLNSSRLRRGGSAAGRAPAARRPVPPTPAVPGATTCP